MTAHAVLLQALAGHGATVSLVGSVQHGTHRFVLVKVKLPARERGAHVPTDQAHVAPRRLSPPEHAVDGAEASRQQALEAGEMTSERPTAGTAIYRPPEALDILARARSAPDIALLGGLPLSGLPFRIRLFIDARGTVVDTLVQQSAEVDEVTEQVRRMFRATAFTAGMQGGHPVPSYKDVELTFGTQS